MYVKTRNAGLDLVRSIAILIVVVCHVLMRISTIYTEFDGSFSVSFHNMIQYSWIGVELFFVLSGFLIGKILINDFITEFKGSHAQTLVNFYSRRWFRTLPMYYLVLIINIFITLNMYPEISKTTFFDKLPNHFFFLQNFFGYAQVAGGRLMEVSWSLVIEEWFYLLFPLFIIVLRKTFKNFSSTTFLRFLIIFILSIGLIRLVTIYLLGVSVGSARSMVFLRLDTMAIGILLAYLHGCLPNIYNFLTRKPLFMVSIAGILGTCYLVINNSHIYFNKTILLTLLSLSIAVFIAFLERNFNYNIGFLKFTSKISYSLYLTHVPVLAFVLSPAAFLYFEKMQKLPVIVTFILFLVPIYLVAFMFYRYFEKPMMDIRDRNFVKNLIYRDENPENIISCTK